MKKLNFGSFLKLSAIIAAFLVVLLPATFDFSNQGDNVVQINTAQATHGIYTYTGPYNLGTCPPPPDDPEQPCASLSAWAFNGIAEFTISAEISWFADSDGDGVYDGFPDEFINHCPIITYTGSGGASGWSGEIGCDHFQVRPVSGSGDGGTSVLIAAGDESNEAPYNDPGYITWTVPYSGEPNQICYGISYSSGSFPFSGSVTPCLVNTNPLGAASFSITSNDPTKSWTVNGEYDTNSGTGSTGSTIVAVDSNGSSHTLVPSGSPLSITCTLNGVSGCGSSVTLFDGDHVDWNIVYPPEGRINVFVNGLPPSVSGSWTITSVDESYSDSGPNGGPYTTITEPNISGETYTITANPVSGCSPPTPIDVTLNSSNNYTASVDLDYNCSSTPTTPTNVFASELCSGSSSVVQITWDHPGGSNVGFRVYRDGSLLSSSFTFSGGKYRHTDSNVQSGQTYSYQVEAYDTNSGSSSGLSTPPVSETIDRVCSSPPPTPSTGPNASLTCVGIPPANPQVSVSWSAVSGATGYLVYRSDDFSTVLRDVGSATSYTDTGADRSITYGSAYTYRYAAYNSSGTSGQSPSGNSVTATCNATVSVSASVTGGSWLITPEGNPSSGSGTASSHTVRPPSSGANYSLNVTPPSGYSVQSISNSDGGANSLNIRPGQSKSFTITFSSNTPECSDTVDNDGDGKVDSADPGCIDPNDDDETDPFPPPAAPNAVLSCAPNIPPAAPQIAVSWSPVSGASGYRLYRNGALYQTLSGANNTSYTDTSLTYNSSYTYSYAPYNGEGASEPGAATPAITATCDATITVQVQPAVAGGSWQISPQASPQNGSGVSTVHTVRAGSGGSNFTLQNIVPPSGYMLVDVKNSLGQSVRTTNLAPGDSETFTIEIVQMLNQPGISASTNSQCERAFITITDNSADENSFELYRDFDSVFNNGSPGETLLQSIPSSQFTGGQYVYQDSPGAGTVYYHARAVRTSPPPTTYSLPATDSVVVTDCPPQLDASISIVEVTRGAQVLPGGTRLRNGDTVTFEISLANLDSNQDAQDVVTDSTITPNLVNFTNFELSTDGGANYSPVNGSLSGTNLLIPSSGSLGDIPPQNIWRLRFDATINSTKTNSAFDRLNIAGIATSSNAFSDNYDLGYILVYLQGANPTQFREVAP